MNHNVYLSLGSNIKPEENLVEAVKELMNYGRIESASSVWETKPIGYHQQPNFLNAVVLLLTPLPFQTLREEAIQKIERALGRNRSTLKYGPRTIDIDILLFNQAIIRYGNRKIPHPEVLERPYVSLLLAEIAPAIKHPETGETIQEIASKFDPNEEGMQRRKDIVLPISE